MQIAAMVVGGCDPINYEAGPLVLSTDQVKALRTLCFFGGTIESGEWQVHDQILQAGDPFDNAFPKKVVWIQHQADWCRNMNVWEQLFWVAQKMGYGLREFKVIWEYFLTLWPTLEKNQCILNLSEQEAADLDLLRGLIMRPQAVLFESGTISKRLGDLVASDLALYDVQLIEVEVCDDSPS